MLHVDCPRKASGQPRAKPPKCYRLQGAPEAAKVAEGNTSSDRLVRVAFWDGMRLLLIFCQSQRINLSVTVKVKSKSTPSSTFRF